MIEPAKGRIIRPSLPYYETDPADRNTEVQYAERRRSHQSC